MALARAIRRVASRPRLTAAASAGVADKAAARSLDAHAEAIAALEGRLPRTRQVVVADLAAGAVVIEHDLGRAPEFAAVAPSVAAADFAWSLTGRTPTTITLTCVGTSQPAARIEVS